MSDWKPGDVVTATVDDRENVRLVAGWSKYDPQLRWCEMSPRWADGDDDECWFMPNRVTNHRRLVAIDPEDREAVERVWTAAANPLNVFTDALREFAAPKPPKPDEPQGLGAVVEDESLVEFVHLGSGLWVYGTTDGPSAGFSYADIDVVRVLSEGVRP